MFPNKLYGYGLTEELLASVFQQVLHQHVPLKWCLKGIPDIEFYQELHPFLKKWSATRGSSKATIERFYIAIDSNLKEKGMREGNVYRFIERAIKSGGQSSKRLMSYGLDMEIKAMQAETKRCIQEVEAVTSEYSELKKKFEKSRRELCSTRKALRDITNENVTLKKRCDTAGKKACRFHDLRSEYALLEDEYAQLQEENEDFSAAISALQGELASISDDSLCSDNGDFTFQTKSGRRYSPAIRKLYYSLLCDQIPSSKIAGIIKTVIRSFNPSVDVEQLQLPQRACADYMRKDELKTISNAHKATVLCEHASGNKGFLTNTDGTTKNQRKLGGVAINNMVISVNEVPDGTAASAIDDVSREFQKLRKIAHAIGMPNPDSINWTLVASSTSDSASSQKRFNKLIEECREKDEATFGSATLETVELIESFCSMHLGINLRKAFLSGLVSEDVDSCNRKHYSVDTFVHEFCKLFGKTGTPEYGCGVLAFPDFLTLMIDDFSLSEDTREYYHSCTTVQLHRQVGSRYFVSAANAAKIVLLKNAAVHFLQYTGKDTGNKLETELYTKLQDIDELARLRADALMYYHVYADLVMLSKSSDLGKSVMDMNKHYVELQVYLEMIECHPEVAMDKNYRVFESERELYGTNKKINHRCHANCEAVYNKLFEVTESESSVLYPLLQSGAVTMREKLSTYAQKQLPGGEYWEPELSVQKVLTELKPSNDLCKSILGLNDYLTSAIPNLTQVARSNLVEMKKNHTVKWLCDLPEEKQLRVLDLAVKERPRVIEEYRKEEKERSRQRQQTMLRANVRREDLKRKQKQENDELS